MLVPNFRFTTLADPVAAARFATRKLFFLADLRRNFMMTQTGPWPFFASLDFLGIGDFLTTGFALAVAFDGAPMRSSSDSSAHISMFGDFQLFFLLETTAFV